MPEIIRSFIAVELPDELKSALSIYIKSLKAVAPKVKWVKSESMHLTLKFLGNQSAQIVEKTILRLLDMPAVAGKFTLATDTFGAFPSRKNPRVFWIGLHSGDLNPLNRLQQGIEQQLQPLGFEQERRKFKPHLTIGRVKFSQDFSGLWETVGKKPFPFFSFEVKEFVLMRSILKPAGAEYRALHKFSLQR